MTHPDPGKKAGAARLARPESATIPNMDAERAEERVDGILGTLTKLQVGIATLSTKMDAMAKHEDRIAALESHRSRMLAYISIAAVGGAGLFAVVLQRIFGD